MPSTDKPSKSVLVVDEDQAVGAVIKAILIAHGYDVITAPDCLAASNLVEDFQGRFGLVITDVMMPNMDGLELAVRLKFTHPDLPILLTSVFASRGIEEHLGQRVMFLEKPFSLKALLDMVRSALNRRWFSEDQVPSAA